jgi:hypothetical protein
MLDVCFSSCAPIQRDDLGGAAVKRKSSTMTLRFAGFFGVALLRR